MLHYDYCDYSNLNSCVIYTLCDGKWEPLFHFAISEYALITLLTQRIDLPTFLNFQKKKGGKWLYRTYFEDNSEGDKMLKLKLQGCK